MKFEELIDSYNNGSRNIEELFEELLKLSRSLGEEQNRHVRENMTEEELVVFDILTRPAPEMTADERAEVKKVARELLTKLKQLLVLNWRQKSSATSQVKLAIEDILGTSLPRACDKPLYEQKCVALFEHAVWRCCPPTPPRPVYRLVTIYREWASGSHRGSYQSCCLQFCFRNQQFDLGC